MKTKILLYAFTARRDVATSLVLKALLERNSCEVVISSRRNLSVFLRFWQPHIVVMNVYLQSVKTADFIHSLSPKSLLVSWPGEGAEPLKNSHELLLYKQDSMQHREFARFLLWGRHQHRYTQRLFGWDPDRFKICGNPRLDLVKFLPKNIEKTTFGILGRFESINRHTWAPVIRALNKCTESEYHATLLQCRQFLIAAEVSETLILRDDTLNASWRPHPLESIEGYNKLRTVYPFNNRLWIDESLAITDWLARQIFVLTPSSTTFLETYLLRVPVINLDSLVEGAIESQRARNHVTTMGAGMAFTPRSIEQIIEKVENSLDSLTPQSDPTIDAHLDQFHNWDSPKSAIACAAQEILALAEDGRSRAQRARGSKFGAPRFAVELIDRAIYYKNFDVHHKNYSYCPWIHKPSEFHDAIVSGILKSHPNL